MYDFIYLFISYNICADSLFQANVRAKIKVPLEKGNCGRNPSSSRTNAPIKPSSSLQKALLQRDELGRTPLHLILYRRSAESARGGLEMKKAPPDLILALLCCCPRAASIPDIRNNYPLHVAIIHSHRTDIVRTLVHAYPGAVLEQNEDMDTPLILAANFSLAVRFRQRALPEKIKDDPHKQLKQQRIRQHVIKPFDSPEDITHASQKIELNDHASREAFQNSRRWEIVSLLVQHRPEAACIRNRHEMSVLEMALQRNAPSNIIRILLRADKSAAAIQRRFVVTNPSLNRGNRVSKEYDSDLDINTSLGSTNGVITPLSLAILRDANEEILGMLSFSFPPALMIRDEFGVGPITKCWLEWFYEVTPSQAEPQAVTAGSNRRVSPRIVCRSDRNTMLLRLQETKGQELDEVLRLLWLKLQTLLCASHHPDCVRNIHYQPAMNSQKQAIGVTGLGGYTVLPILPPKNIIFRPVHAASSQDCPVEVLTIAMLLHPHMASERDEQGRLPLHLAAEAPLYVKQPYEIGTFPMNPIEALLQEYPSGASIPDSLGRLPLHIAIRVGKKWSQGVSALVAADRRVLNTPDPVTGLYPVMMAACNYSGTRSCMSPLLSYLARNRVDSLQWQTMSDGERALEVGRVRIEDDIAGLTTLYELLLACPNIVLPESRRALEQVPRFDVVNLPLSTNEYAVPESLNSSKEEEQWCKNDGHSEDLDLFSGVSDWNPSDCAIFKPVDGKTIIDDYAKNSHNSTSESMAVQGVSDWDIFEITNTVLSDSLGDFDTKQQKIENGVPDWNMTSEKEGLWFRGKESINPEQSSSTVAALPSGLGIARDKSDEPCVKHGKTTNSRFQCGQEALYTDSRKNRSTIKIAKVHFDDELEPYYTILLPNGTEKQTDDAHLAELNDDGYSAVADKQNVSKTELHAKKGNHGIYSKSRFHAGQEAMYSDSRKGKIAVKIIKVHFDDDLEPFYDILLPNGTEKQTDDAHLAELEGDGCLTSFEPKKIIMIEPQENPSILLPDPGALSATTPFDYNEMADINYKNYCSLSNPFDAFDS